MKTEWHNTDKSNWQPGPWQDEPDKVHWIKDGFDCLIVRGPAGTLCGYVGVPVSHPYFGKDHKFFWDNDIDFNVHGGITFQDACAETEDISKHICHPHELAANKTVWWLGFDCGHLYDLCPAYSKESFSDDYNIYRDINYVTTETENLAKQLCKITS